ncbi:MAG: SGNH family hydrolase [Rhodoblastus sp.]
MARTRLVLALRLAAPAALAVCALAAAANAQDSAQSNAAFWLQERARVDHYRPAARQAPRIRRLVPNKQLARPTIWRRPESHPEERHTTPAAVGPEPTTTPTTAPAVDPAVAAPGPAAPELAPQQPATADAAQPPAAGEAAAPPAAQPPVAAAPAPVPAGVKISVAVVGDNIGYHLGQGLIDTEADGGRGLTIVRKTRDSSGLVREDFYDWQKNLRDILAGNENYGAIVVMIGTNDRQELRDATGRQEPLSPRWKEIYTARVDGLVAQLKAKGVPFFWVGLPIMRSERYSSDLQQLNDIYRARVEAAGGKYVDIWDAFADEKGQYNVFGPDVSGQIVKIRTSDGVHFTKAGQRKLAYFVEQAMRSVTERARPAPDAAIAALPPQAPQQQPLAPVGPSPGAPTAAPPAKPGAAAPQAALPAPPTIPPPPPKPEFGPVMPLTAPPLAANGELLGPSGPRANRGEARAAIAPELASGRALAPPRGRADDFAWPRR